MVAKRLTPILNVSSLQQSFGWFEKLGWTKAWDWEALQRLEAFVPVSAKSSCARAVRAAAE
jgi:hypothetical protein